jgi:hypothetical protein
MVFSIKHESAEFLNTIRKELKLDDDGDIIYVSDSKFKKTLSVTVDYAHDTIIIAEPKKIDDNN